MTNREKAEAAWGVPLPDWIEKLATAWGCAKRRRIFPSPRPL